MLVLMVNPKIDDLKFFPIDKWVEEQTVLTIEHAFVMKHGADWYVIIQPHDINQVKENTEERIIGSLQWFNETYDYEG